MSRQVRVLRLAGLDSDEALTVVKDLLTNRELGDLSSMLVLDDLSTLNDHVSAFDAIVRSGQVRHVLSVVIGSLGDDARPIKVPAVIGHGQGSALVWVGDPLGVDWPLSAAAVAVLRPARGPTGLDHLIEALSEVEVFERVRELVVALPDGVASPGLRLAGAGEEGISFPVALATTIRRLTDAPTTVVKPAPLVAVQDLPKREVRLRENGQLAQQRDQCTEATASATVAIEAMTGLRGLLNARQLTADARGLVADAGIALRTFRDHVTTLFDEANAPAGLTDRQVKRLSGAGIELTSDTGRSATEPAADGPGLVRKAVRERVLADDSLPQIIAQLTALERQLTPQGSRAYLPEAKQTCPQPLVERLATPPPPPAPPPWLPGAWLAAALLGSLAGLTGVVTGLIVAAACIGAVALMVSEQAGFARRTRRWQLVTSLIACLIGIGAGVLIGRQVTMSVPVAAAGFALGLALAAAMARWSWQAAVRAWQQRLSLPDAPHAADALSALLLRVAAAEWSADKALLDAISRERIGVKAVQDQLREYADAASSKQAGAAHGSRLVTALAPTLRQLVLTVLAGQPGQDFSDGQAGYRQARSATKELTASWVAIATERGPLAWPPFATTGENGPMDATDGELAAIAAAVGYDPHEVMWQLCSPSELILLDTGARPEVVPFAPRVTQSQLARSLPAQAVWTSSGMRAGLLRLVPLKRHLVQLHWASED